MISKFNEYIRSFLIYCGRKIPQINSIILQRDQWRDLYLKSKKDLDDLKNKHNLFFEREYVLSSLFQVNNKKDFENEMKEVDLENQIQIKNFLSAKLESSNSYEHKFHCLVCNFMELMKVDFQSAMGIEINWRESLICQKCFLNNRQRAVARLANQFIKNFNLQTIYSMEQVTPFFSVMKKIQR